MAKRILSWVLTCALLLTCVSGLTLISSAASTVAALPNPNSGTIGQKDGYTVIAWEANGAAQWDAGAIANLFGLTGDDVVNVDITLDYYWDNTPNTGANPWWHFNTFDKDGGTAPNAEGTNPHDTGFGHFNQYQVTAVNEWATWSISRTEQAFNKGDHDFRINFGDLMSNYFYIRGIKMVITKGEDTYTALWGTYRVAKLDFSTGEIVGSNANITYNHTGTNEELGTTNGMKEVADGVHGYMMYAQNNGFGISFADIGLAGEDVAITVEYYMPSEVVQDNTRFSMNGIGGVNYQLRAGGSGNNTGNSSLTKDAWDAYTFVVTGDSAAHFVGGNSVNTYCYNYADNAENGDYYFIKSISVMPASMLASVADPGYKYYDFTKTYAPNPYYPDYTAADAYGMIANLGDNGTQTYFNVAGVADAKSVAVKFYLAEGSEAADIKIDYQTKDDGQGWQGTNDVVAQFVDGVATYMFEDAIFKNGLNGLGSFRMNAENAAKVARVEVYTLADKTALNEAIAAVIDTTGKTEASIAAYNAALEAAKAVADDTFALQSAVDAAKDALVAAQALKDIIAINKGDNTITSSQYAVLGNCRDEGANIGFTENGSYVEFEVDVKEAGYYAVAFNSVTCNGNGWQQLADGSGNALTEAVQITTATDWSAYADFDMGVVLLQAGVQKLRVAFVNEGSNFKQMTLNYVYNYSEISFENDQVNTINGGINHNHPDEDDADADNGIYEVAEGTYGIKMSVQNRGFGYAVKNETGWLAEGDAVRLVVSYYAPADAVQDNSRLGFIVDGNSTWYRARVGEVTDETVIAEQNLVKSGLTKDAVDTFVIDLNEEDSAKLVAGGNVNVFFWNYNDNPDTGADYIYITSIRAEKAVDKAALQAAVDNAVLEQGEYTKATWDAYQAALTAAQTTLANDMASQIDVDGALSALQIAQNGLAVGYAQITFENDTINTVNGNILHNHPDEDDGDADNGIYEVAEGTGIYGMKVSVQNHGFGFGVNNNAGWLNDADGVRLTISYYAPSAVVQANTRVPFNVCGTGWQTIMANDLEKDVVGQVVYELTADEAAAMIAGNGNVFVHFWATDNDTMAMGDHVFITGVRIDPIVVVPDHYDLPDPNWTNLADGAIGTFEDKKVIAWNTTGAISWNGGAIAQAMGVTENLIADLDITVSAYWQSSGQGDWWHFNTVNEDGSSATSLSGTPNDNGFGLLNSEGYGLVPNEWTNITVSREKQQFGSAYDNLYINVGGLAEGNALYICGMIYEATLADGTVLKGVWGEPIVIEVPEVDKAALQAAVDAATTDKGENTDDVWATYTAALEAAKTVLADEAADQAAVDAALAALTEAQAALIVTTLDLIVESATSTAGDVVMKDTAIKLVAIVKNNGTATLPEGSRYGLAFTITDAEGVQVGVIWSDNYKNVDTAPELKPGDTLTLTSCGGNLGDGDGSWTPDTVGTYTITAFVNDNEGDGIAGEVDRENNQLTFTIRVTDLDITALNAAIADAEAIDLSGYTEESAAAYAEAIATAKAALANAEATQADLDAAAAALTAAKEALVEKVIETKLLGDVNGDGEVNTTDARLVLQYAVEKITAEDLDLSVANVSKGDEDINTTDARLILQKAVEKIKVFPAEEVEAAE